MGNKKTKVLLVDDELDYLQHMSYWFTSKGYSVTVASDGKEALKALKEDTPDIMFLDIFMPVMDGIETLKRLREFNTELPVIVISAYVEDKKVQEATKYGVSGVFYKGEDFKQGLALLESTLKAHKKLK